MRNDELAQALFEAFGKGDAESVRGLCATNFEARQNNGPVMTLEPLLEFALAVYRVVKDFRYEAAVRSETSNVSAMIRRRLTNHGYPRKTALYRRCRRDIIESGARMMRSAPFLPHPLDNVARAFRTRPRV